MSIKLAELISRVREAKTAAEERAVIHKESAYLRTAFKDEQSAFRHRNVAKLLYIHLLGYPSHFGQIECLKLIASPRFLDKRIGYLGLSIFVEGNDVLTLVTNSLSSDLEDRNHHVQGLAITALGNISHPDMLRDLSTRVQKVLEIGTNFVRRKAAVCTIQICKHVPDMVDDFVPPLLKMLNDRSRSSQLAACIALNEMIRRRYSAQKRVRSVVPQLVNMLKQLAFGGRTSEDSAHSVDPFLQVQILRLFRHLAAKRSDVAKQIHNVLAQVVSNSDTARTSGSAILYECIQTILRIKCEPGLRLLAINSLGKFLSRQDNNSRYVALTVLGTVVNVDHSAVLRHYETVVDCLRDPDASIRARAVDLVFSMVSEENIEPLVVELLNFLKTATSDQKMELSGHILEVTMKFSDSKEWQIHTLISVLCLTGSFALPNVWQACVALIGQPESREFLPTVVHRLYSELNSGCSEYTFVKTAVWTIGEFGSYLLSPATKYASDDVTSTYEALEENEVLDTLENVRSTYDLSKNDIGIILNAYVKLFPKFSDDSRDRIRKLLSNYATSVWLGLQNRSCEYLSMTNADFDSTQFDEWLAQMPTPTVETLIKRLPENFNKIAARDDSLTSGSDSGDSYSSGDEVEREKPSKGRSREPESLLLDLDYEDHADKKESPRREVTSDKAASVNLLNEIFGSNEVVLPNSSDSGGIKSQTNDSARENILGVLNAEENLMPTGLTESWPSLSPAYNANGIQLDMSFSKGSLDKECLITVTVSNKNMEEVSNFRLQAAVPKYCQLKVLPPSGTSIPALTNAGVTQTIKVVNSLRGTKGIVMKIKLSYTFRGNDSLYQETISGFPLGL